MYSLISLLVNTMYKSLSQLASFRTRCCNMAENSSEEGYRLEGIAFGLADGLIMCLGLIVGVAEVTSNTRFVIITGIIGGFANAFGNSIGFFMSQSAERALQIQTIDHGKTARIHSKREIFTNTFFAFASTIAAVLVLLSPFTCFCMNNAVVLTFIIGTIMAFILGSYVGKISHENPYKEGLKYALLAIFGAIVSHFIADCIQLII
jgi:predicted membrane protein (TIGR00267 family)